MTEYYIRADDLATIINCGISCLSYPSQIVILTNIFLMQYQKKIYDNIQAVLTTMQLEIENRKEPLPDTRCALCQNDGATLPPK